MNDRFRFRVWDKYIGRMNSTMSLGCWRLDPEGRMVDWSDRYDGKEYILMQCTGLKDKNGKLIYEGDVLLMDWGEDRIPPYNLGPVSWDGERGMWIANQLRPVQKDLSWVAEVIGNIYENPEIGASK